MLLLLTVIFKPSQLVHPFPWDKPEYSPLPWMGDSAAPLTPGTLAPCSTPAFCGQHPLWLNINVYCSCNTLLFAAWYAFLEPHKQKYSLKQLLQPQCTDFEEKVSSVWGTKLYIMLLFIMHLYNDLGSKLIQLSNLNYVCVPLVVHCAACCALYWRRWTQSTASCTLC